MAEPPLKDAFAGADIQYPGKWLLNHWKCGIWTLMPVNLVSDFVGTDKWEELKFGNTETAEDIVFDPRFWVNVPLARRGKSDYYMTGIVPAEYAPARGQLMLEHADPIPALANLVDIALLNQMTHARYKALRSRDALPANQGYQLRLKLTQQLKGRARILTFYFGDFALGINGDGRAELYNTLDHKKFYATWRWTVDLEFDQEQENVITIIPHNGQFLHILTKNVAQGYWEDTGAMLPGEGRARIYHGAENTLYDNCIDIGYTPPLNDKGERIITQPGPWSVEVDKASTMQIQVSRVGYYDLGDKRCELWDHPRRINDVAPKVQPVVRVESQDHGGQIIFNLRDATHGPFTSGNPFIANGKETKYQFFARFIGKRDILARGSSGEVASTTTPELYKYFVDKGARFAFDGPEPLVLPVRVVRIDFGDSPETERLSLTIDNSRGQANAFKRRGHFGIRVRDDVSNRVFFEGTAITVQAHLATANQPETLTIEARGRADTLLRSFTSQLDFTNDADQQGNGCLWQKALRLCFSIGGFLPEDSSEGKAEVHFEDYGGYSADHWNFRLWADGERKSGSAPAGQRWRPSSTVPIWNFINYLAREVLGWHIVWDRKEQRWAVYKRPRPGQSQLIPAKVKFFKTSEAARQAQSEDPETPCFPHQNYMEETARPDATTLTIHSVISEAGVDTATLAYNAGQDIAEAQSSDPSNRPRLKRVAMTWDNHQGYASDEHPDVDRTNPDFLGGKVTREGTAYQVGSMDALKFMGKRIYEDLCHGTVFNDFVGPWGDDEATTYLRKWDPVEVDGERWLIDRIEPAWTSDRVRQARYRCSLERSDAPPPR